jgi:hypothetical protein
MNAIMAITGVFLLLTCEGYLLTSMILQTRRDIVLRMCLGFPLGALLNALVAFVLTLGGIPLRFPGFALLHAIIVIILGVLFFRYSERAEPSEPKTHHVRIPRWLLVLCILLIAIISTVSIVTALTIPSFYWDTFTNWAMRSRLSFEAGAFMMKDVVQPQYPILLHSLEMLPMTVLGGWHDMVANATTLMLSITGFSALFLLVRKIHGWRLALLALTLLFIIPLVVMHLRQGYADIHLATYLLLSGSAFTIASRLKDARWIALSAILVAAASWTKIEGAYTGILPWLCIALFHIPVKRRKTFFLLLLTLTLIVIPWPLFVLLHGLPFSPHASSVELHLDALPLMLQHLFAMGMFGVHWWVIVLLLTLLCIRTPKMLQKLPTLSPILAWGILSTLFFILTYLFTSEVRGLIQGDNFARAMLPPTMLLTLGLTLLLPACVRAPSGTSSEAAPM